MTKQSTPPSIKKTAFECPYCGAFTSQLWYEAYVVKNENDPPLPSIPNEQFKTKVEEHAEASQEEKNKFLTWYHGMTSRLVFLHPRTSYCYDQAGNLFLSECYNCNKIAVWVHDSLVYPHEKQGVTPNQDLPEDIIRDFEEARDIVGLSPRAAAALLRLCIQKLCIHLGQKGKSIDKDIANLVSKGLDPIIQQSLDIVRVIGNESVHPGFIDLNDDRDTANNLFNLVNSIADQMISHPKNVKEMYAKLPENKRKAIDERNKRATK